MKYSTVILALVAGVFAVPQGSTITSAPVSVASGYLTPKQSCMVACAAGDVNCQAACLGSAHPNTQQVVDTNQCAANCDQGDGSQSDTQKFGVCVQSCINSIYLSTVAAGEAVAANTASAISGATSASVTASVASSLASSSGAQETSAASTPTNAANSHSVHMAGAGIAGLLAIFAF